MKRPVEVPLSKVSKLDFVDGKRARGRPKNSWKKAVDRDSFAFGIRNWQAVASDSDSFRRHLRKAMDHN